MPRVLDNFLSYPHTVHVSVRIYCAHLRQSSPRRLSQQVSRNCEHFLQGAIATVIKFVGAGGPPADARICLADRKRNAPNVIRGCAPSYLIFIGRSSSEPFYPPVLRSAPCKNGQDHI